MKTVRALGSGLVGACALTLIHEVVRQVVPDAPRVDKLGERAIARSLRAMGHEPPAEDQLYTATLAGDIISNALYYSLVGVGDPKKAVLRGALLGLGAGVGAVVLPGPLGLGNDTTARAPATQAMTVAWYTAGGLAAGAAFQLLNDDENGSQER